MTKLCGVLAGLTVLAMAAQAKADPFARFAHVLENARNTVAGFVAKNAGATASAWIAVVRAFSRMAERSVALLRKYGNDELVNWLGAYFRKASRAFLVGAVARGLPVGKGLLRWLQDKTKDYFRRLRGVVVGLGMQGSGVLTSATDFAHRLFSRLSAIATGRAKYTLGMMGDLVTGFDRAFAPAIRHAARVWAAAPQRAKALFDRFFRGFVESLQSRS